MNAWISVVDASALEAFTVTSFAFQRQYCWRRLKCILKVPLTNWSFPYRFRGVFLAAIVLTRPRRGWRMKNQSTDQPGFDVALAHCFARVALGLCIALH